MKPITLRGLDESTARALHELADREGLSLNRAALRLLKSATLADPSSGMRIGHALDRYFRTWTKAEARAFDRAISIFSRVDAELWK
ncbi:MAG: hypothetical protein HYY18_15045 [Planctomycetes bacterium]|nr:hypothetical protein [Planctomycetota bacterium]